MARNKKPRIIPGNGEEGKPRLDATGREVLDTSPVTLPVKYQRGDNITERVQRMVEETISRRAEQLGIETVDEANDFNVGDDFEPLSEHEVDEDAEEQFEREQRDRPSGFFKRTPPTPPKGERENPRETPAPDKSGESPGKGTSGNKPETS